MRVINHSNKSAGNKSGVYAVLSLLQAHPDQPTGSLNQYMGIGTWRDQGC